MILRRQSILRFKRVNHFEIRRNENREINTVKVRFNTVFFYDFFCCVLIKSEALVRGEERGG